MKEYKITNEWNEHTVYLLLKGHYSIDEKIAENLSICLGTSSRFWINLMNKYLIGKSANN